MIAYARFTPARYFCWDPFDSQSEYSLNVFAAGLAKSAREPDAAKALIAFLVSPAAKPAIVASGMLFADEKK